jgi:hypothetical protein
MKKLIFLLLVMLLGAGMVFAMSNPVHPPGAISSVVLAEYGVQEDVVTQPTVLVVAIPKEVEQAIIFAVMADYDLAIQPLDSLCGLIKLLDTGQVWIGCNQPEYYLRC